MQGILSSDPTSSPSKSLGKRSDIPGGVTRDAAQAAPTAWALPNSAANAAELGGVLKYFNTAPPGMAQNFPLADANDLAAPVPDTASGDNMSGPRLVRRLVNLSAPASLPPTPNASPPSGSEAPLGIVSGKPMRFFSAPSTALDDLIWNGATLRTLPRDAGTFAPLAPNDQSPLDDGNANPSTGSPGGAFAPPAPQDPQGPLSLNDAYLEYLKRLNAAQA